MLKRLVVAVFVSALTVVGVAPAASAAPGNNGGPSIQRAIDWD